MLHSYGLDSHCRPVLCDPLTGNNALRVGLFHRFRYVRGYLARGNNAHKGRMTVGDALQLAVEVSPASVGITWRGPFHPVGKVEPVAVPRNT